MICNTSCSKDNNKSNPFETSANTTIQRDDNNHIQSSSVRVSTIPIDSIKVGNRFRRDLGDINTLVNSIQEVGLLQPVVVSEDYELIAGQRRIEACKQLGWTEIPIHLVNINEIVKGEFHENVVRKNFTYSEMVAIKRAIEPAEREEAKARMLKGQSCAESAQGSNNGKTRDKVAEYIGSSHDTLTKAEHIIKAAEDNPEKFEEIRQKMDSNEYSVDRAFSIVREQKKLEELESITDPQSDQEILKKLEISIRPHDVWNFSGLDRRFGRSYPGQIPADIVFNTLYFFTKQDDLVVDFMAGGGVVGDVCKSFKRQCLMYDVNPARKDITRHDIVKDIYIPAEAREAELFFWDPPYYKKKAEDYGELSISALSKEEYLTAFKDITQRIYEQTKIKKIALLVSDYDDEYNNKPQENIFVWHYVNIIQDTGKWRVHRHIHCPLSTQQIIASLIDRYKEERKLARLSRSLLILVRVDNNINSSCHVQHQQQRKEENLIIQKSATTGAIALNQGRNFIGIKDPGACKIAKARINQLLLPLQNNQVNNGADRGFII